MSALTNVLAKKDNLTTHDKHNGEGGIRTRGAGVYPHDGLANRDKETVSHVATKGNVTQEETLTAKLAARNNCDRKLAAHLSSDLVELIQSWEDLPEHVKQTIRTLVAVTSKEKSQ